MDVLLLLKATVLWNFSSCKQWELVQGAGPFPKLTGYRKTRSRADRSAQLGCGRGTQNELWFLLARSALIADLLPQVSAHTVMGVDLF